MLAQPWARSLLQIAPKLVVLGHQTPQLWARPAAQVDWSLMESWDCENQSDTGSSPATNPETRAAATSGRTDKIINFSEKLQHLGSIFLFRNTVYWCVWNRLSFGFSGSHEILRKACFRLRENENKKNPHSFLPPGNPEGLAVSAIANAWCRKRIGPRILQHSPDPSLRCTLLSFQLGLLRALRRPGQLHQVGCRGT